jgi:AbrB family looped-hinge helix DNA binding protein
MEVSRISAKGQVTIPKGIRELLNLSEGDRVAFIEENGKVVITKASVVALRDLQEAMSREAQQKGMTEQDLLDELKQVRKEMWNERNTKK